MIALAALAAVLILPPGDTFGPLVIEKPTLVRGSPGARLVRRPGTKGATLELLSSDVTVENLTIVGTGEGTRRDQTALYAKGDRIVLRNLEVTGAWSAVWLDGGRDHRVEGLRVRGLAQAPFWRRGEGLRAVKTTGLRLTGLDFQATQDGVYLESALDTVLANGRFDQSRYAFHAMFARNLTLTGVVSTRHVVGAMFMETRDAALRNSSFTQGTPLGSAGLRFVRTWNVRVEGVVSGKNAAGVELVDARDTAFSGDRLEENTVAWAWGGDNRGSRVTGVVHRGNLADASAREPDIPLVPTDHSHPADPTLSGELTKPSGQKARPVFEGNVWDAWKGWDLDGDGVGDTPYRFDADAARRLQSRPWEGLLLGSPWNLLTGSLPGGEVLDPRPVTGAPARTGPD